MIVKDLLDEVVRRGGDTRAIYLGEGNPEDRYAIVKDEQSWNVYYSEKGEQFGLRQFATEGEAGRYLLGLLERDETVWRRA